MHFTVCTPHGSGLIPTVAEYFMGLSLADPARCRCRAALYAGLGGSKAKTSGKERSGFPQKNCIQSHNDHEMPMDQSGLWRTEMSWWNFKTVICQKFSAARGETHCQVLQKGSSQLISKLLCARRFNERRLVQIYILCLSNRGRHRGRLKTILRFLINRVIWNTSSTCTSFK